jgi:hypothetical protein
LSLVLVPGDRCPGTVIPELTVPTVRLKVDHFELTTRDTTFDTVAPAQAALTTADTFGCSCEQIIAQLDLGQEHKKFGCSLTAMQAAIVGMFPAPVSVTGQTDSFAAGDDGDGEEGVRFPTPRFTDNLNGTMLDNLTGLIWLKSANRFAGQTWFNALNAANTLASGSCGFTDGSVAGDWRLPNVKELQSLIDFGHFNPSLPLDHPFSGVQSSLYWSSTTYAGGPRVARQPVRRQHRRRQQGLRRPPGVAGPGGSSGSNA